MSPQEIEKIENQRITFILVITVLTIALASFFIGVGAGKEIKEKEIKDRAKYFFEQREELHIDELNYIINGKDI